MKSIKSRLVAGLGAALLMASVSSTSMASWSQPAVADVSSSLGNITAVVKSLVNIGSVDIDDIKIVYLEDVLNDAQLVNVKNTLNNPIVILQVLSLQNVLKTVSVLNGSNVLTFGDVLSNNNVDLSDVVAVNVFDNGQVLAWGCKTCK